MQLLFKTLIIFFQKCFTQKDQNKELNDSMRLINESVSELLDLKDVFNMELGYASSMVLILLSTFDTNNTLRTLLQNCLDQYKNLDNSKRISIKIRDLCFFQAFLTMLKSFQIINENLIDLFELILLYTLERYFRIFFRKIYNFLKNFILFKYN